MTKRSLACWLFCSVLAPAGCGSAQDDGAPAAATIEAPPASPEQPGPFKVGVTTFETTDGEPGGRVLPVEVWYPAQPPQGAEAERYALVLGKLKLAEIASPQGATRDPPADTSGGPYPVIVFSHGNGGVRIQSVYLCEYLASHGFVVAAPDHTGNTFAAEINSSLALPTVEVARLRPIDVSRTLDAVLARSAAAGDLLSGMVDGARAGVAGHSFGGFTALRIAGASIDTPAADTFCQQNPKEILCRGWADGLRMPPSARDPRFLAALPQAPGGAMLLQAPGGKDGLGDVAIPTMIQAGTTDQTTPYAQEALGPFASMPPESYLLTIERAGHYTFSDICSTALASSDFQDGCSSENLAPEVAHAAANQYATAFFQATVAHRAGYEAYLRPDHALPQGVSSLQRSPDR
jgi:predicted dienelactone hydrolase